MKNLIQYYDPEFTTTLEEIPIPYVLADEIVAQSNVTAAPMAQTKF